MSRLEDRILEHPVRRSISALRRNLEVVPDQIKEAVQEDGLAGVIERGTALCDYLDGLLESAEPTLVSGPTLDAIAERVDQATEVANQVASDYSVAGQLDLTIERTIEVAVPLAVVARLPPDEAKTVQRRLGAALKE